MRVLEMTIELVTGGLRWPFVETPKRFSTPTARPSKRWYSERGDSASGSFVARQGGIQLFIEEPKGSWIDPGTIILRIMAVMMTITTTITRTAKKMTKKAKMARTRKCNQRSCRKRSLLEAIRLRNILTGIITAKNLSIGT